MDKHTAQKLVQKTLGNSFNKEDFVYLVKNILNYLQDAPFSYTGNLIFDDFADSVRLIQRVGKYVDPDGKKVDILIVHLQNKTSLERARTKQRNFVAKYLNGSRGRILKDAALVAFVAPNGADWRFSFVQMQYRLNEKGKVEEEFTPARRYSFLVGPNENSHTAQSRLLPALLDDDAKPKLKKLEDIFSVERVTKEFFEKYRELFLRLKKSLDDILQRDAKVKTEFEVKNVNTVDFAKKLLGQVIFLYFLQKKGWFGVRRDNDWGSGSKSFLRELFEKKHGGYDNFFDHILEPLFYEALRRERSDNYYSRFDCRIPFLNGGLFDPINNYDWVNTDILIPDNVFSNNYKTKEGDTGNGILDIFDRYNFTVKEDEPLEKEVAIDPELLGKAYEKFNAIRPENFDEFQKSIGSGMENKFNKKFGVYYTPREIVHYMCQQSLIHYLVTELEDRTAKSDIETLIHIGEQVSENEARVLREGRETETYSHKLPESVRVPENAALIDQKLSEITVCDPAVGSGAFPVAMMNEVVRARNVLSLFLNDNTRNDYELKHHCIEHSLYGVDIDPGAVEIAKLRLWLSLVVDETNIRNIKPLPNLDYRIMQGNSLIDKFMGINFDAEKPENTEILMFKDKTDELIGQFQQKKDEFLNESSVSRKADLKEEIENLLVDIFEAKLKTQRKDYFKKLESIESRYSLLPNKKDRDEIINREKEELYKTSGFDADTAKRQLREFSSDRRIRPFFLWKLYFSEVFHEKKGYDVVIGNPPYIQLQKNGGELSKLYKDTGYVTFAPTGDIYCLFYEKGIDLLKANGHLCYITSNKWLRAGYGRKLREFFIEETNSKNLLDFGGFQVFEHATVDTNILLTENAPSRQQLRATHFKDDFKASDNIGGYVKENAVHLPRLGKDTWFIGSKAEINLKEKIERLGKPLKEWDIVIYRGVLTGYNAAFIIDNETKDALIAADANSANIIKPILRGRDIKRYRANWAGLWLIDSHNGYQNIPPIDIEDYPAIKAHLDKFYIRLKKRQDKGITPYNLRNCAYHAEFEKEKIIWGNLSVEPRFAVDIDDGFISAPTNLLTGKNYIKYIAGVLNSQFCYWRMRQQAYSREQGYMEYKKMFVERIPIPKGIRQNLPLIIQVEDLVEQILAAKTKDLNADTTKLERQINKLVYRLYELTFDEINIIEST